jgi:serine O-acetyltransferase
MTTQAAELRAWADPAPRSPLPFWECVREDIVAHIPPAERRRSRASWTRVVAGIVLRSSGFHVTVCYRLAHTLYHRVWLLGGVFSGILFWWSRHFYGCSIAPTARLYGGLILSHPQGIVVGPGVLVGPRAWIFQNATLGGAPGLSGMPRVGADARIFAGAVLAGPITVGDNVMVGANAVIYRDVPSRTAVRCPPAELSPLPALFINDEESDRLGPPR